MNPEFVESTIHRDHPMIPLCRTDFEGGVPHPQPGVATLFAVGLWSTPVLAEEQCKATGGGTEVRLVGVEAQQHLVSGHPSIERSGQGVEERLAANRLVNRDLSANWDFAHPPSIAKVSRDLLPSTSQPLSEVDSPHGWGQPLSQVACQPYVAEV